MRRFLRDSEGMLAQSGANWDRRLTRNLLKVLRQRSVSALPNRANMRQSQSGALLQSTYQQLKFVVVVEKKASEEEVYIAKR